MLIFHKLFSLKMHGALNMLSVRSQFLSPVSTVSARNAWDQDSSVGGHTRKKKSSFIFKDSLLSQLDKRVRYSLLLFGDIILSYTLQLNLFTGLFLKSLERLGVWIVLTYTFSQVVGVCFKKLGITRTVVASFSVGTRLHTVICWLAFIYI